MLGSALGDGSPPFIDPKTKKPHNVNYEKHEPCYPPRVQGLPCEPLDCVSYKVKPLTNVRLGGIAPAASLDTFDLYTRDNSVPLVRVAMATNPRDSATGKGPLWCKAMGSSCMAVKPSDTCRVLHDYLAKNLGTEVAVWDFHQSEGIPTPRSFFFWREHKVEGWRKNSLFGPFLRYMLTDEQPDRQLKAYCGS